MALLLALSFNLMAQDYNHYAFDHVDPENLIPDDLQMKALAFYEQKREELQNDRYVVVIDFSKHSSKERFFIIDMQSGDVETYLTSHGKNSDPKHTGFAQSFSNVNNSLQSSLGLYMTAESYYGSNGYSLRLDGLSSTNSNARKRAIVIHGADYVKPGKLMGRSYGCPALENRYNADIIDRIKGGALIYAGVSK